jgi:type I restriction enzyme S subunit
MADKSKKPAIRFAGFTDAWEQRKFEDIAVRSSSMSTESGLPRVEYEDIISGTGRLNKDIFAKESEKEGIVFHKGDVLYGKLRPYLQNWLLPSFNGLAVGDFWVLQPQNADSSFLYRLIQSRQFDEVANQSTGTKMPRADWKLVSKTEFYVPHSLNEQSAIGAYFTNLDDLITLHQRKYDKLQNVKKSMLEKMFPKNGRNIPEIRFAGFTDAWEQRKLTDIVEFFSGLTYTPSNVQETGTLVLRSSNVSNGEIVDADNVYVDSGVVNSENVKDGDIIVVVRNGSRSLIGKHAQIKRLMPHTVIGAFMTGVRSKCPSFTNALLNTPHFDEEVAMNMGATINQITGYMFSKMEFAVPSIDEQEKIGLYFEQLDDLITLHQRELEKLKNLKKACLEKMFV